MFLSQKGIPKQVSTNEKSLFEALQQLGSLAWLVPDLTALTVASAISVGVSRFCHCTSLAVPVEVLSVYPYICVSAGASFQSFGVRFAKNMAALML